MGNNVKIEPFSQYTPAELRNMPKEKLMALFDAQTHYVKEQIRENLLKGKKVSGYNSIEEFDAHPDSLPIEEVDKIISKLFEDYETSHSNQI